MNEVPSVVQAVGEAVGLVAPAGSTLSGAVIGVRAKDVAVPGAELVSINSNQKVKGALVGIWIAWWGLSFGILFFFKVIELEQLLRQKHIHAVPVWNGQRYEGSVDTADLITWAILKFPRASLDAWTSL